MEASLHPYSRGAIVEYVAPFDKKVCQRNRILGSHPVLILNVATGSPSSSVQCMMLTSKVDSYFGYRIYMNTLDPKYRRFSVVCTTKIFTIEKCHLRTVLGYASAGFVEKCLNAYLFELGLSQEIPDYYQQSPLTMAYLQAGEPNIPRTPEGFHIKGSSLDMFERLNVASEQKPRTPDLAGVRGVIPRSSVTFNEYDSYFYEATDTPIPNNEDEDDEEQHDAILPSSAEDENAAVIAEHHENIQLTETAPETTAEDATTPVSPEVVPSEDGIPVEFGEGVDITQPYPSTESDVMTAELKNTIEDRDKTDRDFDDNVTKNLLNQLEALTDEDRYEIWIMRKGPAALVKEGKATSSYMARKIIAYSNHQIKVKKEALINGVIDKTINLRFMSETYCLPMRCMTVADIYDIKMGVATYFSYLQLFNIPVDKSYIGELQRNDLL